MYGIQDIKNKKEIKKQLMSEDIYPEGYMMSEETYKGELRRRRDVDIQNEWDTSTVIGQVGYFYTNFFRLF